MENFEIKTTKDAVAAIDMLRKYFHDKKDKKIVEAACFGNAEAVYMYAMMMRCADALSDAYCSADFIADHEK